MFRYILKLCKTAVIITANGQILVSSSISHRTAFKYQYNLQNQHENVVFKQNVVFIQNLLSGNL
jgi:urease accessory protein UreE